MRPQVSTPTLDTFGRDLTRAAGEGKLGPVLHRDEVIDEVLETLCRRTKRNPVLVGPAGVGKTAIVEGVAQRIATGSVPEMLRGVRLIAIQPSSLVAGSGVMGELENRMKAVVAEASQPGIVLFIDEIHSMMGAGGLRGATDMASLLKPVLARGDIACIGATTDDEYRSFIEEDKALERRFNRINVEELSQEKTLAVLGELRNLYANEQHVAIEDQVLAQLVWFSDRHMKNRHFPDKAVDLLEQCVARAIAKGKPGVDVATANEICERIVGMPVDMEECIPNLSQQLARTQLSEHDAAALANRLQVTVRGLDVASPRPNAVILLAGPAESQAGELGAAVAQCLFGSDTRVIEIDFSRFTNDEDVSLLLGSARGYVGYGDPLPIHQLVQTPWSVLICRNVDQCHPMIRAVLRQALASGYFTDSKGRRIYLSDAIVLLTSRRGGTAGSKGHLGFALGQDNADSADETNGAKTGVELTDALGADFLAQIDLIITQLGQASAGLTQNLQALLASVSARYAQHNLDVVWDPAAIDYIVQRGRDNWERFVDLSISPQLIRYLPGVERKERVRVVVNVGGDAIKVELAS